jgi:hypothetical protein
MAGSAQETIINLISLFATLTCVAFVGVVVPPTTLFFWHPFTLTFAYGLLSIQGILIAYSKSSILEVLFEVVLTKKRARFFTHMLIQYGCGVLVSIGFGSKYLNIFYIFNNFFYQLFSPFSDLKRFVKDFVNLNFNWNKSLYFH